MSSAAQVRDSAGRFLARASAGRFDVERLPALPASAAAVLLRTPRRPLVLVWADPAVRVAEYVVTLDVVPGARDLIRISPLGAQPGCVLVIRQRVPGDGQRLLWLCPACTRRSRLLFIGPKPDASDLTVACRECLSLQFMSRGGSRIRKALTRQLAGIEPGVPIPRTLCHPTIITADTKALKRFRNLVISEAPDGVPTGVVD